MSRTVDILLALGALLVLLPLLILLAIVIAIDSKGGIIYRQGRVGKNNVDFKILKFRTMHLGADKESLISSGSTDQRVTKAGAILRKYKLDELPQLVNIIKGDMSIVGPRPEVRKYVDLYTDQQMKVLSVNPGLTDYASLEYYQEGEMLATSSDPEKLYVEEIMPAKLELNMKYIDEKSLKTDLKVISRTIGKIIQAS